MEERKREREKIVVRRQSGGERGKLCVDEYNDRTLHRHRFPGQLYNLCWTSFFPLADFSNNVEAIFSRQNVENLVAPGYKGLRSFFRKSS